MGSPHKGCVHDALRRFPSIENGKSPCEGSVEKMANRLFRVFLIVATTLTLFIGPGIAHAQVRLEIRPVETATLTSNQFLTGDANHRPVTLAAELRLPVCDPRYSKCSEGSTARPAAGKVPAVVLIHGSAGILPYHERWVQDINSLGIATLLLDSFSARGIVNTASDQSQLDTTGMMIDAYRALELLVRDERIDRNRIAVMGFSKGAVSAVYSSSQRFTKLYAPSGAQFAAHIGVYTPCYYRYRDDDKVTGKPLRLFHGTADDYTPIEACRAYVARLKQVGVDAQLTEYPGAYHLYDSTLQPSVKDPEAQTLRNCRLVEDQQGRLRDGATNEPFTLNAACIERGATRGPYNEKAAIATAKAVKEFLLSVFGVRP